MLFNLLSVRFYDSRSYVYDDENRLVQTFDSENNLTTKIEYDKFGRIAHTRRSDGVSSDIIFDKFRDFSSKTLLKMFGIEQTTTNTFGFFDMLESSEIKLVDNNPVLSSYACDELGGLDSNVAQSNGKVVKHKVEYEEYDQ